MGQFRSCGDVTALARQCPVTAISARHDASDQGGPFKWQRAGRQLVTEVGPVAFRAWFVIDSGPADGGLPGAFAALRRLAG